MIHFYFQKFSFLNYFEIIMSKKENNQLCTFVYLKLKVNNLAILMCTYQLYSQFYIHFDFNSHVIVQNLFQIDRKCKTIQKQADIYTNLSNSFISFVTGGCIMQDQDYTLHACMCNTTFDNITFVSQLSVLLVYTGKQALVQECDSCCMLQHCICRTDRIIISLIYL